MAAIQVLERAFAAIDLLAREDMGLSQIASATQIQPTTLRNILKTLEDLRVVERTGHGQYSLGEKLVEIAKEQVRHDTLRPIAQKVSNELAFCLAEDVIVAVMHKSELFVIAFGSGMFQTPSVTVEVKFGWPLPLYEYCTGRILLAYQSADMIKMVVKNKGLPEEQWHDIQSIDDLLAELENIKIANISSKLENDRGRAMQAVAVPIWGPDNTVWASMGSYMPAERYVANQVEINDQLQAAATQITESLKQVL